MHARPSHDARRRAWRFAMAVLTIAAVWQGAAQSAMAAQHNPRGRFLGVVHSARGAARAQAPAPPASNLTYHDGPVMHTNRTHAIYWEPSGFSTTATYKTLINGYLGDVAADSGKHTNVYASDVQYTDTTGRAAYSSTFAGAVTATDAYPASGCSDPGTSVCLNDSQIQAEVDHVVATHGLPRGLGDIYLVMTPAGVGSCFDSGSTSCAYTYYCAYHSDFDFGAGETLYANQPYAGDPGCDSGQHPNGDVADSTMNLISHEHNETITDPLGTGWWDSSGNENGDKCAWTFGTALGSTADGAYNQLIDGGHYYLQREWSNASSSCVLTMPNQAPTASFASSPASPTTGQVVSFDGGASADSDGTIATYSWTFGDGGSGSGATPTHTYATAGTYTVKLTVTDNDGTTGSVSHTVSVSDRPPVSSFTFTPLGPVAGQSVSFDGTGSSDPDGTVTSYAWSFGDGSSGSGATPSHAYAQDGTYTATLTVSDNSGSTAQKSHSVTVGTNALPTAAFTFSPTDPTTGQTVGFDGSGSSDPDGTVTGYSWNFGDGSPAGTGVTPSHTYASTGTYSVTLTVTDNAGATRSTSHDITVTQPSGGAPPGGTAGGGASAGTGGGSSLPTAPTGSSLGSLPAPGARLVIPSQSLRISPARAATVLLRCTSRQRCGGTLAVWVTVRVAVRGGHRLRTVVLGRTRVSIAALHSANVSVRLSRLAASLLRSHARVRVRVAAALRGAATGHAAVARSVWLLPAVQRRR